MTMNADEQYEKLRARIHDIAEVVHQHGSKIEIGKIELGNLKGIVEGIVESGATREQLSTESRVLQLKLDQVSNDVAGIKGDLKKVTLTIVIAVLMAMLGGVLVSKDKGAQAQPAAVLSR